MVEESKNSDPPIESELASDSMEPTKTTINSLIDSPFIELLIVLKCKSIRDNSDNPDDPHINALLKHIINGNKPLGGANKLGRIGQIGRKRAERAAGAMGSGVAKAVALGSAGVAGALGAGLGAVGGALYGMGEGARRGGVKGVDRTLDAMGGSDPETPQTRERSTPHPTQQVHASGHDQQDIVVDDSDVDKLIKKLIEHCDGDDILLLITTMLEVINSRLNK